jgi:hypothetical protein
MLDDIRNSISATLSEIQLTQSRLGIKCDPADREAYDIICRIERRLLAQSPKKEPDCDHQIGEEAEK